MSGRLEENKISFVHYTIYSITFLAAEVGSFVNTNHGLSGSATFNNPTTITLKNFNYDGSGVGMLLFFVLKQMDSY